MEMFAAHNLSFTYPGQRAPALCDLTFSVGSGEFVVLVGSSGCGKSTLLRQLKSVLAPHGQRAGRIEFEGRPLDDVPPAEQSARIGFVRQDPDSQIVTDKVWHELAFGLESLGLDTPTIRARVAEMAAFFGIESWFYQDVGALSGGQKQLLNLASVMAMQPSVLILDEPTSQLDPIAASEFLSTIGRIHRELGTTILMTEHRLDEALPLCDRVLVLDHGRLLLDGPPREIGLRLRGLGHAMFASMPVPMQVHCATKSTLECPITIRDGRLWLEQYAVAHPLLPIPPDALQKQGAPVLTMKNIWFRYAKDSADVLRGFDLTLARGELLALMGSNGAGKSTALSIAAGLNRPYRGTLSAVGRVCALAQNPQALFLKNTVSEDLLEALPVKTPDREARMLAMARLCRIDTLLDRHPYDLSGGEQQRAALAKVLLQEPDILLLDEPTKGLDAAFKQHLAAILHELLSRGVSILVISHDVEFCACFAHRCVLLFDGIAVSEGSSREFFSGNSFYTTSANRMARQQLPQAVTAADLIAACGGRLPHTPEPPGLPDAPLPSADSTPNPPAPASNKRSRLPKRTQMIILMLLLLIPVTICLGLRGFGDRKYYLVSLLVLFECMAPFFLIFEGRKPQARELVLIAALCALGVAGRAILAMLPQCKPVIALVIIAGVAFGGETGFLVGAVTMLVSNVLFGQGPWTPWQMFAMGLIGLVAGALHRAGLLRRSRAALCIFGATASVVIFGGIMNPASALIAQQNVSVQIIVSYCLTGLPMDLMQAASTAAFLWFFSQPMLDKLDRVKLKYGLVQD